MLSKNAGTLLTGDVLLSIHRRHAENIFAGLKAFEIRKTVPKAVTFPFSVYMYETKGSGLGLVVGKFECERIQYINCFDPAVRCTEAIKQQKEILKVSCLDFMIISIYAGNKRVYGWHITEVVRYDRPRELSDFGITRPPQSWCYLPPKE